MTHLWSRIAGFAAIVVVLLAPAALASASRPGPEASRKAKEKAYGKHCGPRKGKHARTRARCLDAMAKLATGDSASPRDACRGLPDRRARGERTSAFERCVRAGTRVVESTQRAAGDRGAAPSDGAGQSGDGDDDRPAPSPDGGLLDLGDLLPDWNLG